MGDITFIFGMDVTQRRSRLHRRSQSLGLETAVNDRRNKVRTKPRRRPEQVKQRIVDERKYKEPAAQERRGGRVRVTARWPASERTG